MLLGRLTDELNMGGNSSLLVTSWNMSNMSKKKWVSRPKTYLNVLFQIGTPLNQNHILPILQVYNISWRRDNTKQSVYSLNSMLKQTNCLA